MTELLQPPELFPAPATLQGATKSELATIATGVVDRILEYGNSLQVAEYMKSNEELAALVRADKRFPESVREDAGKYGKGGYNAPSGAVIKLAEVGVKYDYSVCNDPELASLLVAQGLAEAAVIDRQKMLKTLPADGLQQVDEETGDTWRIYPPAKTSTSSYTVTLAK